MKPVPATIMRMFSPLSVPCALAAKPWLTLRAQAGEARQQRPARRRRRGMHGG